MWMRVDEHAEREGLALGVADGAEGLGDAPARFFTERAGRASGEGAAITGERTRRIAEVLEVNRRRRDLGHDRRVAARVLLQHATIERVGVLPVALLATLVGEREDVFRGCIGRQ